MLACMKSTQSAYKAKRQKKHKTHIVDRPEGIPLTCGKKKNISAVVSPKRSVAFTQSFTVNLEPVNAYDLR
jgi:hypothetical protein